MKHEYRINYQEMVKWLTALFLGGSISSMLWHGGNISVGTVVIYFLISLLASFQARRV